MENQKGITLVALVTTIIIILILTGVTIGSSSSMRQNMKTSKSNIAIAELKEVQQIVLETYIKYKQNNNANILTGTAITYSQAETYFAELPGTTGVSLEAEEYDLSSEDVDVGKIYYELTPENLKTMGISNDEDTYIVNYYTGEVFNYTGKQTADGDILYVDVGT